MRDITPGKEDNLLNIKQILFSATRFTRNQVAVLVLRDRFFLLLSSDRAFLRHLKNI